MTIFFGPSKNKIRTLVYQDKVKLEKLDGCAAMIKSMQQAPHWSGKTTIEFSYEITIAVAKLDLHQNYEPTDSSISGYILGSKQCRVS